MVKSILFSAVMLIVSTVVALLAAEGMLRVKNSSMQNYDIEMWKYSGELKVQAADPKLGHVHVPDRSATLQSVEIRTNEIGMRGGPVPPVKEGQRRILFLGSSITLGWGVAEEDTVTSRLQTDFAEAGQDVVVFNGGVGNYNSERYVELFMTRLKEVEPTDIVVHYFLRDAEKLEPGGGNILMRNSQLMVTLWIAWNRVFGESGDATLFDHYDGVYDEDQEGYIVMRESLTRLAEYAKENNIRVYLAMVPDVHNLADYQFGFIHERMKLVSSELGYEYVDLLPAFGELSAEDVWAMPGDPHPNGLGHELMAKALFPVLSISR